MPRAGYAIHSFYARGLDISYMQRKVPTTFTIELDQLERLVRVATRTRVNRSLIVRDALDRELARYEEQERTEEVGEDEHAPT